MHALKDHPDLTYVMAMQESLVVAMADGFSRASGKLVACNVHVAPGLGNAMGSLLQRQLHRHADDPDRRPAGAGPRPDGAGAVWAAGADGRAAGEMGGRGDAAGGSAADRAPRRQDRDHAADRAGVHLAAGRHPQCRGRHRTRPLDPRRYPRQAVGRIAAGAGRAHPESGAAGDHRRRRDRQERCVAGSRRNWRKRWAVRPISPRRPMARNSCPKARASWARWRASRRSRARRCALRSHHRARRRSAADVGLQRDRSAAGRAVDRAGRPGRLGPRQELRRRDRAQGRREGNPARAGAGAEGRRRRRARSAREAGIGGAGVEELDGAGASR